MTTTLTEFDQIASPPQKAVLLAERLHGAFSKLIAALPGQPQRPMDLARKVGVDKSVAHRLMTAMSKPSPMGVLLTLPGPVPLTEIAQAARRLGVDPAVCAEAIDAASEFDGLVQEFAGDRATFDAMLCDWVDDARDHLDAAARQLIFRGMKHVHGIAAETAYTAFFLHPSATNRERGDLMTVDCALGIHRVRNSGKLCVRMTSDLRGSAVVAESARMLLEEYCSKPTPRFKVSGSPDAVTCELDWDGRIGRQHVCDAVVGELERGVFSYVRATPTRRYGGLGCTPWVPVRRAVMDLALHRSVFPECLPSFFVSRTGVHGIPDPNDPQRLQDRIRMSCPIQAIGAGEVALTAPPEVPFYRKMLETQTAAMGWNLSEFRAFRIRIDYPIFDSQHMFVITLPEAAR